MANTRDDVLSAARRILCRYSLADLSMRRLAGELGVRPNALYWHFPNKQTLLAALADEILSVVVVPRDTDWHSELRGLSEQMRAALVSVNDSAELVSTSWASGLARSDVTSMITDAARRGGMTDTDARAVSTALCQLVLGLTIEQQTRAQMERLGVLGASRRDFDAEFAASLDVVLDGARVRAAPSK